MTDCHPCQVVADNIRQTITRSKIGAPGSLPGAFRTRLHATHPPFSSEAPEVDSQATSSCIGVGAAAPRLGAAAGNEKKKSAPKGALEIRVELETQARRRRRASAAAPKPSNAAAVGSGTMIKSATPNAASERRTSSMKPHARSPWPPA
jgi:hypothetical protein